MLTPGQRGKASCAADLVDGLRPSPTLVADRGYDSDPLHVLLVARGLRPARNPLSPRRGARYSATHYDKIEVSAPQPRA